MQKFKENDALESKVLEILRPFLNILEGERIQFFNEAYTSYPLGDVLFDLDASPLAGSISKAVFRTSYFAIHDLFTRPGTFEFYLEVFKAIFGDDVEIEFEVPEPGKLHINVQALTIIQDFLVARSIVSGAYVYDDLVTHEGDNIVAQVTQGPKTQSEMDAIMIEIKPQGIWVETSLVIT